MGNRPDKGEPARTSPRHPRRHDASRAGRSGL